MDRLVIILLLMICGGCTSLPLGGQQATNNIQDAASQVPLSNSNESLVDLTDANLSTGNTSLKEDLEAESNLTDGGVDTNINTDGSNSDSLSNSFNLISTVDAQANSTNTGDEDNHEVTTNNNTFVFFNDGSSFYPFARNRTINASLETNGTFGKEGGDFFVNIKNRLNITSPDAIDRQNQGFGWFSKPGNGAFGQSYSNIGYPSGPGVYNGYDYSYPGGYRIPAGSNWPGYVPGGGYGGYPYDGYGYGVGPGYVPPGYEFSDGYGYMNWYPNGYSSGYEYWKRIFGLSDPWYWSTSPRGYWNSVESWG